MDSELIRFDPKMWGDSTTFVDLHEYAKLERYPPEIHNCLFEGKVENWNFPSSTYKSRFNKATFINVSFHNKDFKDCLFDDCKFISCEITFASIVSSTFRTCYFKETPFKDEAIHDCLYQKCLFDRVSFVGSMIRNSTIEGCDFHDSETSNKVFDACFLTENDFKNTKLDFRAIRDNFGLSQDQIAETLIREDRSYPNDKKFNFTFEKYGDQNLKLGPVDLWKIKYYQDNSLMFYGDIMDDAFNIQYWMKGIQTPNNFVRFLEGFSEFIIHEYLKDRCLYYLVIKLHSLTYQLYSELNQIGNFSPILQAVAGIHIRTGEIMSEIDHFVLNMPLPFDDKLLIRTDENTQDSDIEEIILQIKQACESFEYKIIKRNSPIDISFLLESGEAYITIMTYFLMSKTKLEIEKIMSASKNHQKAAGISKENDFKKSFAVGFGLAKEANSVKLFSMSSNMWGNYSVSITVLIGTRMLKKMRKVLFDLISA